MSQYRWLRYRTLHSHGPSAWEWQEREIKDGEKVCPSMERAIAKELNYRLTTGSEHWRGVEVEFADPPREVLKRELKWAHGKRDRAHAKAQRIRAMLKATA